MRVVMVNPRPLRNPLGSMEKFSPAIPPLGPVMVATQLQEDGHEVRFIDAHAARMEFSGLLEELEQQQPDIVMFSCLTFAMDAVEEAATHLRRHLPEARIVLGNLHATLFHEDLVNRKVADAVVRGEGELTTSALVDAWSRGTTPHGIQGVTWKPRQGRAIVEPDRPLLEDLSKLPRPDWSMLPSIRYEAFRIREFDKGTLPAPVMASRGCAFNCSFCSQNIIYQGLRLRPVSDVLDEMEAQAIQHDIRTFGFVDANFPTSKRQGMEFCQEFKRRGLVGRINWFTEVRVDLVDQELIRAMGDAGCRLIQFGVESGDDIVLTNMNKETSAGQARDVFRWCRNAGIRTVGLFVIGMPGETEEQVERTVKWAIELDPDLVKISVATPYPGSALWEQFRERLERAPYWKFSGWLDPRRAGAHLLEGETIPSRRLARLQRRAMRRFYSHPRVLYRLLREGLLRPETFWTGALATLKDVLHLGER